jgi:hypothetical protein
MIKYIFSTVILLISISLSRRYVSYLYREVLLAREISELVSFLDERMGMSLAPIPNLIENYNSKLLSECGFLSAVCEGVDIEKAFLSCVKSDGLDKHIFETARELFSKIGKSNIATESERIKLFEKEIQKRVKEISEDFEKRKTVITTLSLAYALGFIILLL